MSFEAKSNLTAARALSAIAFSWLSSVAFSAPPDVVDFNEHIRPIFTAHCTACHGGVKQAADLSFVYGDQILDVVDPESPEDSYLIERVTAEDDEYRMPPSEHGPRLSDEEIALLKKWIGQGGEWARHWAYQLPQRHVPPEVSNADWCRQPIDSFALAQLDARGIAPAPDAQPERWLRRVSFDLTGLPPTLDERTAFLEELGESEEAAYEAVVDRLLASPRFGERWASMWFDQVRYADSRGLSEDSPRDIWKYRDWVIDAFNRDLPYDEFTRKQIAGDLIPDRTIEDQLATSIHRLTHTNEEGGTDDEEFRIAAVIDRISTTWQTWQGTTMGCVQCHDHPYDPIRHEEFYQFMAYFNNTADCDFSDDWPNVPVPLDQAHYEQASQLDRQTRRLEESLWREKWQAAHLDATWQPLRITYASTSNATKVVVEPKAEHDEYHTTGTVSTNPTIKAVLPIPAGIRRLTGIRVNVLPLDPATALPNAEVGFVMSEIEVAIKSAETGESIEVKLVEAIGDEPFPYHAPNESLKEGKPGFGAFSRIHHPRSVVLLPESPIDVAAGSELEIKIRYGVFDLAAFLLVARRGHYSVSSDPELTALRTDEALAEQNRRLEKLREEREAIPSIATPVLMERPEHLARPSHRFIRGMFLTKDEQVLPGIPQGLGKEEVQVPDRLALADWLVGESNPLASRVAVNRFWARMFGTGLVSTEEDFGSAGQRPSHPELLDDLAVRFREAYDWSVKQLLREIALSRVYRQSSRIRPEIDMRDRQNRWLARGPRHTLPAESLRDQMLAISGLLSDKMYGPPAHPPLPSGVWKARRGTWKTPPKDNEDRYRRSVYTFVKRSVPFPMHTSFDAPSRDVCVPQRLRSNTPLQSLMLLNDKTSDECAHALATTMTEKSEQLTEQIRYGLLRATCRTPESAEIDRLVQLYQELQATSGDHVAMQATAAVILNLDEIISK